MRYERTLSLISWPSLDGTLSARSTQAGLDSLGAVELRSAIASRFSVTLPATAVFDHPSPAALAELVAGLVAPKPTNSFAPGRVAQGVVRPESGTVGVAAVSCRFPGRSNQGTYFQSRALNECHQQLFAWGAHHNDTLQCPAPKRASTLIV